MSKALEIDPKRVSAAGSGVDHGVTGQSVRFQVQGLKGQIGKLTVNIDGPSQPNIDKEVDDDGNINCEYIPTLPGDYTVVIKAVDKHIKGSPFKVQVIGDSDPKFARVKRVEVAGKGIAIGKAYQQNEFWVDCRGANIGGADLSINVKNPERAATQLKINDMQDGTFKVFYKPTAAGCYVFNIKIEGIHVPGSPFYVRIT